MRAYTKANKLDVNVSLRVKPPAYAPAKVLVVFGSGCTASARFSADDDQLSLVVEDTIYKLRAWKGGDRDVPQVDGTTSWYTVVSKRSG